MAREGRFFEIMMMQLQQFCAGEDVEILSPEIFRDDEGNVLGEVDITLRSRVGTASTFLGIECRDRPSQGPQAVDWVREIYGKKQDLKIDKMVAVSSTGFTEGAKRFALENQIDLIAVDNMDAIDVREWVQKVKIFWQETEYALTGPIDVKVVPGQPKGIVKPNLNTPCLDKNDGKGLTSVKAVLEHELQNYLTQISPDRHDGPFRVRINITGPFDLVFLGKQTKIERIEVPMALSFTRNGSDVLMSVCQDISEEKVIGLTGYARLIIRDTPTICSVIVKRNRDNPEKSDTRLNFMTEDYEPYELPEGMVFSLYGYKKD